MTINPTRKPFWQISGSAADPLCIEAQSVSRKSQAGKPTTNRPILAHTLVERVRGSLGEVNHRHMNNSKSGIEFDARMSRFSHQKRSFAFISFITRLTVREQSKGADTSTRDPAKAAPDASAADNCIPSSRHTIAVSIYQK
jgi:hypothetical protein